MFNQTSYNARWMLGGTFLDLESEYLVDDSGAPTH